MLELSEHLRSHLPPGNEFEAVFGLPGELFRAHKNRRTIRSEIGGRTYFIKAHGPTGWREILKNALRGRWPVLTAETERMAIRRLEELGVPTIHASGFGVRGRFPDRMESFIITDELRGMIHLDELPPKLAAVDPRKRAVLTRRIIARLATTARALHTNGLNHRDFYLCHFMLRDRDWSRWTPDEEVVLHVIDLHRLQSRTHTPRRWVIKDIAGLLFSSFDAGLTSRDFLRFLSDYWGRPWREQWNDSRGWRRAVIRRAVSLYRSEHGKPPRLPAGLSSFS